MDFVLDRQKRLIITIVVAVIYLCGAIVACLTSFIWLAYSLDIIWEFGWLGGFNTLSGICTGTAFLLMPVIVYLLLLHGYQDNGKAKNKPAESLGAVEKSPPAKKDKKDDDDSYEATVLME